MGVTVGILNILVFCVYWIYVATEMGSLSVFSIFWSFKYIGYTLPRRWGHCQYSLYSGPLCILDIRCHGDGITVSILYILVLCVYWIYVATEMGSLSVFSIFWSFVYIG